MIARDIIQNKALSAGEKVLYARSTDESILGLRCLVRIFFEDVFSELFSENCDCFIEFETGLREPKFRLF